MFTFKEISNAFVGYIAFIALSFFLGYLLRLLAIKSRKGFEAAPGVHYFWNLFTGTFLLIALYAIYKTGGLTIFMLTPFLLFFFTRQKLLTEQAADTSRQTLIFFSLSIVLNFLFYYWALSSFTHGLVTIVSGDFNIYFRIAQNFNEFGVENSSLDPIYKPVFAEPYHYGDIWMYALVSRFVSTNPSIVFLVAFAQFSVIFINGVYTYISKLFAQQLQQRRQVLYLLLFAGLFTGFNFFFPKFILPSAEPYTLSVMNWAKVLVPSCVLVALLTMAKEKNWLALTLLATAGGLAFINSMPAIFIAVFLLLGFLLLRRRISFRQWLEYQLSYGVVAAVFIIALYKILPQIIGVTMHKEYAGVSVLHTMDIKLYAKTATNIFIGGWFQLFVLIPFFILLAWGLYAKGKLKNIKSLLAGIDDSILLLCFIIFSGLFCWALLHNFDVNSVQFFSNVLSPFSSITICVILVFLMASVRNRITNGVVLITLALCIYGHRQDIFFITTNDEQEWKKLDGYLSQTEAKPVFVNLKKMSTFNAFFEKYTTIFIPLSIINYKWPDYTNVSLNAPFIPVNPKSVFLAEETNVVNSAPFMVYYKAKNTDSTRGIEDISLQFVAEQNVGYISVSKDTALPVYFRTLVRDSLKLEQANFTIYRIR